MNDDDSTHEGPSDGALSRPVPPRRAAIPWGIVAGVGSVVSLAALTYYYRYNRELSGDRQKLLKERAALAAQIADDYGMVRGKVEPWTVQLAGAWASDFVHPDARLLSWRERPALYLRVRQGDATSNDGVHAAVRTMPLDAVASCLLRSKGAGPWSWGDTVVRAEMLGADFLRDVRDTGNDLRLRNLAYALEYYKTKDFPEARDALRYAEHVVIVVDEDPTGGVPTSSAAFGPDATPGQKILGAPHPVRLAIRRISDGTELLRVRRTPEATLMQVQGDPSQAAASKEVILAQSMGCQVANEALALVGVKQGGEIDQKPPAIPVAAPAASSSAAPAGSASAPASASASGSTKP